MTLWRSLTSTLRQSPASIPALGAIALAIAGATSQAAYPVTDWAPAGLILIVLVAIAALGAPLRLRDVPLAIRVAAAALAAYTALSYLSILWAGVPGDAWEGANRTLLYLLVFVLFALWRRRGASAALLLCVWTLAMTGLSVWVALRLNGASASELPSLFTDERLSWPAGYVNAAAAEWMMAFWPALLLAARAQLPWGLRGLLGGGAVVFADLALLSQSRGAVYATALTAIVVFALLPGRLRTFAAAVPVAAAVGLTAPLVLRVGARIGVGRPPFSAIHTAVAAMLLAGALAGLAIAAGAALESRRAFSPALVRRLRTGLTVAAVATLLGAVAGGLVAAGDPVARARSAWHSFKGGYTKYTGNRLLSGLGSGRYDFYRVALDEFTLHPTLGLGADNFYEQYLAHGRSGETPRYPHSIEMRTLADTGAAGTAIALVGLGAALLAAWRALRRADPLGRTVAAAAMGGFAYWALHGSFDWFWEFAGLGGAAFALLGIACSLDPTGTPSAGRAPAAVQRIGLTALALATGLAAAGSLAAPWLSERQIQSAAAVWTRAPFSAYAQLHEASELNPLSDRAETVAATIALRFGDLARAREQFGLALRRVPDDAYATLQLGAIASASGQRGLALRLLRRAVALYPRDPLSRHVLAAARTRRVNLRLLNREILTRAQQFQ